MARKNNPRNLRSSVWSNPMFCLFRGNKHSVFSWAQSLQTTNNVYSFLKQIHLKTKNKKFPILKLVRVSLMSYAFKKAVIPLLSKSVPGHMQSLLNKQKFTKKYQKK